MRAFGDLELTGWYPGHMLKAGGEMRERLRLVDAVVEILDARLPATSRNPAFEALLGDKPRFLVFNKADLVPPEYAAAWTAHLVEEGQACAFVDSLHVGGRPQGLLERWARFVDTQRRGRGARRPLLRPARLMVVGIPNVGKSTLINRMVVRKRAEVGPRPGVTRNQQWVRLTNGMELLDTPGVLWPRIRDKLMELNLALIGAIKDELVGEELLCDFLHWRLCEQGRAPDWELYGLNGAPGTCEELLLAVARRRGMLAPGGAPDRPRAAAALLKDFRDGRLGRVPLDGLPT